MKILVALVAFNPLDTQHTVHPWIVNMAEHLTGAFRTTQDRQRAYALKFLRKIWGMRYGNERANFPDFVKEKLEEAVSATREMGWLMKLLGDEGNGLTNSITGLIARRSLKLSLDST